MDEGESLVERRVGGNVFEVVGEVFWVVLQELEDALGFVELASKDVVFRSVEGEEGGQVEQSEHTDDNGPGEHE